MNELISIIIRTRNEERWIGQCLREVFAQEYPNKEVIIVDNESADKTLEKAKQFPVAKILTCRDYLPGKALNMGIREAKGSSIVCLSGHCIPVNTRWLSELLKNFNDEKVAGVYGRQEPMSFTSNLDKRDLALIFGLDRKVQTKDSFFHNANSMIRRRIWEETPFDEQVTNIEDRVWAQKVLQKGYCLVYEPQARVYHYHGIHQDADPQRCTNVVRIMEALHRDYTYKKIDIAKLNIVALIPVKGAVQTLGGKPLLSYTLSQALASKFIKKTVVSTDNPQLAGIAERMGACVPFLRDESLSRDYVDLTQVLSYSLQKLEENRIYPDLIVSLEITFPFRPAGLIDELIADLTEQGLDSIIAARRENKGIWREKEGAIVQIEEGMTPRQFKEPTYIELKGLGCVTHPEFLREGRLLGNKIGIFELNDPFASLEVRSEEDRRNAEFLIGRFAA